MRQVGKGFRRGVTGSRPSQRFNQPAVRAATEGQIANAWKAANSRSSMVRTVFLVLESPVLPHSPLAPPPFLRRGVGEEGKKRRQNVGKRKS